MPSPTHAARRGLWTLLLAGLFLTAGPSDTLAQEAVLGEETIDPGIAVVFEGAIKDAITPSHQHLAESRTDVHLEARINWSTDSSVEVPDGTPRGGYIPGLHVYALIENEGSDQVRQVTLTPHLNLIDNFHYARNVALPDAGSDTYRITFHVHPPDEHELSFHRDWTELYGDRLFAPHTFEYEEVDFSEIVDQTRR